MIPWLLVAERICTTGIPLAEMVATRIAAYPCSGEINFKVAEAAVVVQRVHERFAGAAIAENHTDGLSLEFPEWRFNLRSSNTEPLLRLNVETRANPALLADKTSELSAMIDRARCVRYANRACTERMESRRYRSF